MTGTIIYYNSEKGFGFIQPDESQEDIFFHISKCNGIPEVQMRVKYDIADGRKGIEAVNVSII